MKNLSKTYPPVTGILRAAMKTASEEPVVALSDVSFDVNDGEVVGLVGPNGAGKTTLFRILANLLERTEGSVEIDGRDVKDDPVWAASRIGLVLEGERGVYSRLSGLDNLEFFGMTQGMDRTTARERGRALLEGLGIDAVDRRVFGYSAGMRVRVALARSLMADPSFLLLDEPTRSLDPIASQEALKQVAETAGQGRSVLMSNHRLSEVYEFCDRVVILLGGRVRYDGSPRDADMLGLLREGDSQ